MLNYLFVSFFFFLELTNSYYTVPTPNVFARFITWPRLTFSRNHALRRSIEDLRGSIRVFEELENEIYALVQLWGWANIEPQVKRSGIVFDDSSLRESSVVNEWTLLRDHFADYSNMVCIIHFLTRTPSHVMFCLHRLLNWKNHTPSC